MWNIQETIFNSTKMPDWEHLECRGVNSSSDSSVTLLSHKETQDNENCVAVYWDMNRKSNDFGLWRKAFALSTTRTSIASRNDFYHRKAQNKCHSFAMFHS